MGLLDQPTIYEWEDTKENGAKNPRARKKKKLTDKEYFDRLQKKDEKRMAGENHYAQRPLSAEHSSQ